MFELIPASCNDHISSIYAQLGHPQINFDSFWDVYNQLREAVDEELLFRSSTGVFDDTSSDDPDDAQLPFSHLRPCRFGEGGNPAGRIVDEGEVIVLHLPLRLIPFLSLEVRDYHAGERSGMAPGNYSCKCSYLPRQQSSS